LVLFLRLEVRFRAPPVLPPSLLVVHALDALLERIPITLFAIVDALELALGRPLFSGSTLEAANAGDAGNALELLGGEPAPAPALAVLRGGSPATDFNVINALEGGYVGVSRRNFSTFVCLSVCAFSATSVASISFQWVAFSIASIAAAFSWCLSSSVVISFVFPRGIKLLSFKGRFCKALKGTAAARCKRPNSAYSSSNPATLVGSGCSLAYFCKLASGSLTAERNLLSPADIPTTTPHKCTNRLK